MVSKDYLKKIQKYHRKHQKGKSPFYNPDAGNVPMGDWFFNHTSGKCPSKGSCEDGQISSAESNGGGQSTGQSGSGGMGESIKCNKNKKIITEQEKPKMKLSTIENEIRQSAEQFMMQQGSFQEDELEDYLFVQVEDVSGKFADYDQMGFETPNVRIQVSAELGFDDMMNLAQRLNEVVKRLDKNELAYFDSVDSGIIQSYLTVDIQEQDDQDDDIDQSQSVYDELSKLDTESLIRNQKFYDLETLYEHLDIKEKITDKDNRLIERLLMKKNPQKKIYDYLMRIK